MNLPRLLLISILLAPAALLRAQDDVPLERKFSFRLTTPDLLQPPAALAPALPAQPPAKRAERVPLAIPGSVPLPPGSRPLQFNGQTYYFIPL